MEGDLFVLKNQNDAEPDQKLPLFEQFGQNCFKDREYSFIKKLS